MTTVFEYLKIEGMKDCVSPKNYKCTDIKCEECRFQREVPRDGNLMVSAINKMRERGDWERFENYAYWTVHDNIDADLTFSVWLFGDPANFFKLMQEALDKGIIAAQP
jgi:hypothetical protein